MNIVFSSTKQWNPGDELILQGVRNLLGEHTFIIFNRHPHLTHINKDPWQPVDRTGDNSYYSGMGDDIIDYVVFGGSPEYHTFFNNDLYNLIEKKNIPFSYIGVGGFPHWPRPYEKAEVAIVRDSLAANIPDSIIAPCPSIYSVKELDLKPREKKEKIVFCFQSGLKYICSPEEDVHQSAIDFIEKYKPKVCCHSYPDYVDAYQRGWDVFYSSRMEDYFDFYSQFDMVVGTRIHGAGWGANYGIPSITIAHDERIETAQNFGSVICTHDNLIETFENFDVKKNSSNIIEIRKDWFTKYMELLEPIFGKPEGWKI
tara:strand:- start:121 stop:1062 length:942 start_codon:yes stop_codon:yes gene_type:complete